MLFFFYLFEIRSLFSTLDNTQPNFRVRAGGKMISYAQLNNSFLPNANIDLTGYFVFFCPLTTNITQCWYRATYKSFIFSFHFFFSIIFFSNFSNFVRNQRCCGNSLTLLVVGSYSCFRSSIENVHHHSVIISLRYRQHSYSWRVIWTFP